PFGGAPCAASEPRRLTDRWGPLFRKENASPCRFSRAPQESAAIAHDFRAPVGPPARDRSRRVDGGAGGASGTQREDRRFRDDRWASLQETTRRVRGWRRRP